MQLLSCRCPKLVPERAATSQEQAGACCTACSGPLAERSGLYQDYLHADEGPRDMNTGILDAVRSKTLPVTVLGTGRAISECPEPVPARAAATSPNHVAGKGDFCRSFRFTAFG
eukprot:4815186-Pleurochrysis_carterae.AAC.6